MKRPDYIVVGAGAAGSVVAARLSENPGVEVLLLEAGRERRSPLLSVPAAEVLLMGNAKYDWQFVTEPDPTAADRRLRIPRGRILGGSNAVNGMLYVRGQPEDYDEWAERGNTGWGWDGVLPYFMKLERTAGLGGASRGHDGPIDVQELGERTELCDRFLSAAATRGYTRNPDYNSGDQEGFGYYQATVRSGVRSSVVNGHLADARGRPNLTVLTAAAVTALRVDGSACVGVTYEHRGRRNEISCSREVIVSAGTVQSPQLLELSGLGSSDVLKRAGVPVVRHLPGVGENFRDHFAARMKWRVTAQVTLNDRTRGLRLLREIVRYALTRRGPLAAPIAHVYGFLRSSDAEDRPDLQFHFTPGTYGADPTRRFEKRPGMTVGIYPLRPESAGSVHITSNDSERAPEIRPRFLEAEADRQRLVAGMRLARSIVDAPSMDKFRHAELMPGAGADSDDELLHFVRQRGDTSYHPVGTCQMGDTPMSVVDGRLRVHGIRGLRVIDASVMPTMVSGNTNAAAMMIGEKGADMVVQDNRLQPAERTTG